MTGVDNVIEILSDSDSGEGDGDDVAVGVDDSIGSSSPGSYESASYSGVSPLLPTRSFAPSDAADDGEVVFIGERVRPRRPPPARPHARSHRARSSVRPVDDVVAVPAPPPVTATSAPLIRVALQCAVCLDAITTPTSTTCGHVFCKLCIRKAISRTRRCPMCRKSLTLRQTHPIFLPEAL
ncbi:uncharacterized protein AMSG_01636 [Thecamonas trahens ATCC 50062]|uniref:RING-type domain-containing protein n=1 Tax=Thecamonas trahens ATCC 50062 TaxID=461836 RepID=A0A0L0DR47_THETB|nr:hypothetical protein AMSG_01636 [Thecamonas trahens ATCC 50062]KNC54784.1 hypothetical protein AMSG_01636 [Thecamonas trahens ATCC 50062]|eukprot:XP_013761684.1 hypothetical protein AMSG_01636 [Thecamonas trahens ATCC 50062]